MKEWDLCKCFCALNAILIATSSVEQIGTFKGAGPQWFS